MRVKTLRAVLCIAALMRASTAVGGQPTVDRPGSQRPIALTKPRVSPLPEAQWTDVHRQLVAKFSRDGRAGNGLKTLLHVPEIVDGVMPYTIYLSEESSLSPRHRELLVLRTAWLCGNQALWSSHAARARKLGMTASDVRRIAQGPDAGGWDAFEATLLRLADQLYRNASVSDATWKVLAANYDLFHLMDAVETVNHFTMLSLLYNSLGVQSDEETKDRLPRDVPYRVVVPAREPPLAVPRVEPGQGSAIAVGRTFARYPRLAERWSPRQTFVNRISKLQPRYREMLILRTGWNCRSEYEWAQHVGRVGRAREHGLEPIRIAEGPDAPGWDPFERVLLQAADELYRDGLVSNRAWSALADRFDTALSMSVVFTASTYRAISMALNAFGVQLEPGDERFPQLATR